jgi:hypothetical protein
MQIGIMATDGGAHPPEKWARTTASQIISIASSAPDALLREATDFEARLVETLTKHHGLVQDSERGALGTEGPERLASVIDTSQHTPDAVDDVIALARGTSFAAHFAKPEVRAYLERLLHEHFHHSMHIERSWHADANPDHPHAVAFRAIRDNGHAVLTDDDSDHADKGGRETVHAVLRSFIPGAEPLTTGKGA